MGGVGLGQRGGLELCDRRQTDAVAVGALQGGDDGRRAVRERLELSRVGALA